MKKLLLSFLCVLIFTASVNVTAFAGDGSGNMNGGGGEMGSGTSVNVWHNGDDGIRITVVRASDNEPVTTPFDFTNKNESDVYRSFYKKCKLQYKSGASLEGNLGKYTYKNPAITLPTVITGTSTNNIAAIKSYFTDETVVKYIAQTIGIPFDSLISEEKI